MNKSSALRAPKLLAKRSLLGNFRAPVLFQTLRVYTAAGLILLSLPDDMFQSESVPLTALILPMQLLLFSPSLVPRGLCALSVSTEEAPPPGWPTGAWQWPAAHPEMFERPHDCRVTRPHTSGLTLDTGNQGSQPRTDLVQLSQWTAVKTRTWNLDLWFLIQGHFPQKIRINSTGIYERAVTCKLMWK